MVLLHSQPLSPILPIPLQMQGPSPLNVLPQGFSSNHCSSCYCSCYACGIPCILHTVQDSEMALKEKSHGRENEFVSGAEVQRDSTQGALHTGWVQSFLLRGALGVTTLKSTPTTSPRTPPRPVLGSLTTLLPCLALQGRGCPFSQLGHKHPLPARCLSSTPNSCMLLPNLLPHVWGCPKMVQAFSPGLASLQVGTSQLLQPTSTPASSALFSHPSQSLQGSS